MRILLFGNYHGGKQFYDELSEWLTKSGYNVDLLDWGKQEFHFKNFTSTYSIKSKYPFLDKLTRIKFIRTYAKTSLIRKSLRAIKQPYDIINIHYGNARNNRFIDLLKKKGEKLVVTIWGSDFHRVPDNLRQKARKLYDNVDIIHIPNPEVQKEFIDYYNNYHDKVGFSKAGFGDNKFQRIDELMMIESKEESKKKVGIPSDSFVITCGYKAYHVLQHFQMLEAIKKVEDFLPNNYLLVFPLTYHRDLSYIELLKNKLAKSGLNYLTYDEFLSEDEISRLRISSDIYITIPESDGASSSLLEYMTAGNVVIAGEWLPYQLHKKLGLYFHTTSLDGLSDKIKEVLVDFVDFKNKTIINKTIVLENFSWSVRIKEWEKMFESLLNSK
jgi:glycosyltransferase involved in cell wall biosynthesis